MRRRHAISPGFSGHYRDLGIWRRKSHDSAYKLIVSVDTGGGREIPVKYQDTSKWGKFYGAVYIPPCPKHSAFDRECAYTHVFNLVRNNHEASDRAGGRCPHYSCSALYAKCPRYMQRVLVMLCFICKINFYVVLYIVKCPCCFVLDMQRVLII